jgi:hypothetical protein
MYRQVSEPEKVKKNNERFHSAGGALLGPAKTANLYIHWCIQGESLIEPFRSIYVFGE